jgi:hypothetical protein
MKNKKNDADIIRIVEMMLIAQFILLDLALLISN